MNSIFRKILHRFQAALPGRNNYLGPLHTQAKSRDHTIVRAQKKVSKGHPNTPPKSYSVVTDPRVQCEVKLTGPSIKCYFNETLFMWVLTYDENKINQ